jgi:hypothetical protein
MLAKGEKGSRDCLRPRTWVKAKAAPNLQNRKWLNFQDKIEWKPEVSKLKLAVIVHITTHDAIRPETLP